MKTLRKFVISVTFCCNFAIFSDFKTSEVFSKNSYFLKKNFNFCTLWVILLSQSVSMETFHRLTFTCYNKAYFSVSKNSFFSLNPKLSNLWEFFLFQSRSAANLLHLEILRKARLSQKARNFLKENPKFARFE